MESRSNHLPKSFWIISIAALVWNLLGVFQYLAQAYMTDDILTTLPEEQQELYTNIPAWATAAFAIAVFAGLLGSILLLLKKKLARPVFIVSLVAIIVHIIYVLFVSSAVTVFGAQAYIMPVIITLIGVYLVMFSKKAIINQWLS